MRKVAALIVILAFFTSCDSNVVVSETRAITTGWDKDDNIKFTLPELDSLATYNIFLHLRNSNDFPYNNIFLVVKLEHPHGKTTTDTLEYRMAYPNGAWMGTGIGSVKESKLWYKENILLEERGNYNITITHAMRNNGDVGGVRTLPGIVDVGYSVESTTLDQ